MARRWFPQFYGLGRARRVLHEDAIPPTGKTKAEIAALLGASRQHLHERRAASPANDELRTQFAPCPVRQHLAAAHARMPTEAATEIGIGSGPVTRGRYRRIRHSRIGRWRPSRHGWPEQCVNGDRGNLTSAGLFEIIESDDLSGVAVWLETCMYEIWMMT